MPTIGGVAMSDRWSKTGRIRRKGLRREGVSIGQERVDMEVPML